jgi:hypothetical protein
VGDYGSANGPTVTAKESFSFDVSVLLHTPGSALVAPSKGSDSLDNPITFTASGTKSVTFSPDPTHASCSASYKGISGLSDWRSVGFGGGALARITIDRTGANGSATAGYMIHAYAHAPAGGLVTDHAIKTTITGGTDPTYCQHMGRAPPTTAGINSNLDLDPQWQGWLTPLFVGPVSTPSYSQHFKVHDLMTTANGTDLATASGSFSLSNVGTGVGGVPPTAPLHLTPDPIRAWALEVAKNYFKLYTLFSESAQILLKYPLPPDYLTEIQFTEAVFEDDFQFLFNTIDDPPLAGYETVARASPAIRLAPPSCAGAAAATGAACKRLAAALTGWANALANLVSLEKTLATDVGRESGAAKHGDKQAVSLQQHAELALLPRLRAAAVGESAARAKLVAVLRAEHFVLDATSAQIVAATARVRSQLAAHGITATSLETMQVTPLAPQPLDLLATLLDPAHPKAPAAPSASKPGAITGKPAITSVAFGGTPSNPSITIKGTNLGSRPAPSPSGHPSGRNGCPVVAGDNGYDYGTSLYIVGVSKGFAGGRYRPSLNETDCIDLVVTKFSPTEVDLRFGPFYTQNAAKFGLNAGDAIQVVVNGAAFTTTVRYS